MSQPVWAQRNQGRAGAEALGERTVDAIVLRQIRPDDWHRLQRFHRSLSPATIARRFHGAKAELSEPLAHRFTDLDGVDEAAIVATDPESGRIVGVARYGRLGPGCAEVAFVVEDAYQGHGLGRQLMWRLADLALRNGITTLVAEILPGNVPMMRLMHEVGKVRTRFVPGGVMEVTVNVAARSR